jgi:hypothetical protein
MKVLQKIHNWYVTYDTQITWFLIGYNLLATVDYIAQQNWAMAAITAFVVIALITAERVGVRAQ